MRHRVNGYLGEAAAITLAALLLTSSSSAAPEEVAAERLADTTTDPFTFGGSRPMDFVRVGDAVFFSAETHRTGRELWVTDGTDAGTRLVRELVPGGAGSHPRNLIEKDGLLYFEADTAQRGVAPWRTDGTAAGTVPVESLPQPPAPPPLVRGSDDVRDLRFFAAEAPGLGFELFRTDGTPAGRVLVKDINPGAPDSGPDDFVRVGDVVFFTAHTEAEGTELWKTDGTRAGTVLVKDARPGPNWGSTRELANLDDRLLLFQGWDSDHHAELWRSDGTEAGTFMVKDLLPGLNKAGAPSDITAVGDGTAYFQASNERALYELWRTDGTEAGTYLVSDIEPDPADSHLEDLVVVSGGVVFTAGDDPGPARRVLWSSDGTPSGTAPYDMSVLGSVPYGLAGNGTNVFALANESELFVGGLGGPGTLTDLVLPPGSRRFETRFLPFGDEMLFSVDFDHAGGSGHQMWITDGTFAGTAFLGPAVFSDRDQFDDITVLGDTAFIHATQATDGTEQGTRFAVDLPFNARANSGVTLDDRVAFIAKGDGTNLRNIHVYDPAADELQTVPTVEVRQFERSRSRPYRSLWGIGGSALFLHARVDELWKTDGTIAGTRKITDLTPGWHPGVSVKSDIAPVRVGQHVLLAAITPETGLELYRLTDGAPGITLVADIAAGAEDSRPNGLLPLGTSDYAVFAAADADHGMELWITDGTPAGTGLLSDVRPGPESSNPRSITLSGTNVVFAADGGDGAGEEPWVVSLAGLGLPAAAFDGGAAELPPIDPPSVGASGIDIGRVRVNIDFRRLGWDRLTLRGTLPVPPGFEPEGARVIVEVEGWPRAFELNAAGRSNPRHDLFRLRLRKRDMKNGSPAVPFFARLRGDLRDVLGPAGLTEDAGRDAVERTIRVGLLFDVTRSEDLPLDYRVRRRRGKAAIRR